MSSTTVVPALLGFVLIFGVWILAERLHLSAVLAMVACGRVLGQSVPASTAARGGVHARDLPHRARGRPARPAPQQRPIHHRSG